MRTVAVALSIAALMSIPLMGCQKKGDDDEGGAGAGATATYLKRW